jgi:FtsP/CotA-like multicopper oxidase with cupredoxin domain
MSSPSALLALGVGVDGGGGDGDGDARQDDMSVDEEMQCANDADMIVRAINGRNRKRSAGNNGVCRYVTPSRVVALSCILLVGLGLVFSGIGAFGPMPGNERMSGHDDDTNANVAAAAVVRDLQAASRSALLRSCAAGQKTRRCTSFEGMHGGIGLQSDESANAAFVCYCPGQGKVRDFTLEVYRTVVPNRLVVGGNLSRVVFHARHPGTVVVDDDMSPGPTLIVDEHDWVRVRVVNRMSANSTTVHWHGMIQHDTVHSDGVPALTQCEIGPGQEVTYEFSASLSGTFWWHSHSGMQLAMNMAGAFIVNRRFRDANQTEGRLYGYDTDFTFFIQDFYSNDADTLLWNHYLTPSSHGHAPVPDTITVNGKFSGTLAIVADRHSSSRLRFVAANTMSDYTISVDGVRMLVIETDGTNTVPTAVANFTMQPGQRVSVVVDWRTVPRSTDSVYIRITDNINPADCIVPPYAVPGAKPLDPHYLAVAQFRETSQQQPLHLPLLPTYTGTLHGPHAPPESDVNQMSAVPLDPKEAPAPTHFLYMTIGFSEGADGVRRGTLNGISHMPHGPPILHSYLANNDDDCDMCDTDANDDDGDEEHEDALETVETKEEEKEDRVVAHIPRVTPLPSFDFDLSHDPMHTPVGLIPIYHTATGEYNLPYLAVIDMLIVNTDTGGHPIHKHTHPFWLISTSEWPEAELQNRFNYPRRDVVTVVAGGWSKIRFIVDNPGVWALHCHIDWHAHSNMFATLIEAPNVMQLSGQTIPKDFLDICHPTRVSRQQ